MAIKQLTAINKSIGESWASVRSSDFKKFLNVFLARKVVVAGLIVLFIMFFLAVFATLVSPYSPYEQDLDKTLQKPSSGHLLGTDVLGRDLLSRIIHGTRVSLAVGFVSVAIAGSIGMLLGLVAGNLGGAVDSLIMRVLDAMMAIPLIILALFLSSIFGKGLMNVCISVGIGMAPTYARLTRGQVLGIKNLDYVTAGKIGGASNIKNTFVHILPNCIAPNIVLMTMNLGNAILAEAALSFLGLGINPPMASWGGMVSDGYRFIRSVPSLSLAPGVFIMLIVLAFNIVGDALRDALDPRLRGTL